MVDAPVKTRASRRLTFLQATLIVSFLVHALGLMGWSLAMPARASKETGKTYTVELVSYQEARVVQPAKASPPSAEPSQPIAVPHATSYIGRTRVRPPRREARGQSPDRPVAVIDVPAPPISTRTEPDPSPTASTVAAASPPGPGPSPTPPPVAAVPSPAPSPIAAIPSPQPMAAAASPEPSPTVLTLVQNPRADFRMIPDYHNDDRVYRTNGGRLQVDVMELGKVTSVRPALTKVPSEVIPLTEASRYGLHVMDSVSATVKLSVDSKTRDPLPQVQPTRIDVLRVTINGKEVEGALRDELVLFIQDGLSRTVWVPGWSNGGWTPHTETSFEVKLIQVSDGTAMAPPSSRAP